jgi:hypothetical protein
VTILLIVDDLRYCGLLLVSGGDTVAAGSCTADGKRLHFSLPVPKNERPIEREASNGTLLMVRAKCDQSKKFDRWKPRWAETRSRPSPDPTPSAAAVAEPATASAAGG